MRINEVTYGKLKTPLKLNDKLNSVNRWMRIAQLLMGLVDPRLLHSKLAR